MKWPLLIAALVIAAGAGSTRPAASTPADTTQAIVQGAVTAQGGAAALNSIRDFDYSGTLEVVAKNLKGSISSIVKPPLFRTEQVFPGARQVTIFDGKSVWMVVNNTQAAPANYLLPYVRAQEARRLLLLRCATGQATARSNGREVMDGRQADVIDVQQDAFTTRVWIDAVTHRVIKTTYTGSAPTGPGEVRYETRFGDYRKVGAVLLPFEVTSFQNDAKTTVIRWTTIKLNTSPKPTLFSKPAA